MTDAAGPAPNADAMTAADVDRKRKESYFTASQRQLIWARFKKNLAAMVAGFVLIGLVLIGFFAPFLSPYDPTVAGARQGLPERRAADSALLRRQRLLLAALHLHLRAHPARLRRTSAG